MRYSNRDTREALVRDMRIMAENIKESGLRTDGLVTTMMVWDLLNQYAERLEEL